jgi:adenylylsulfate kinase
MTGGNEPRVAAAPTPGWVFWITGLAGAGKTTVARHLAAHLRASGRMALVLDGDAVRAAVCPDLGYAMDDRHRAADCYSRLARLLAEQGADVVVATISMFDACRTWNRSHIARYYEIYLRASAAALARRSPLHAGDGVAQIVGIDLPYEAPRSPDLVVDTDADGGADRVAARVWSAVRDLRR